jgi:hypothetical protein
MLQVFWFSDFFRFQQDFVPFQKIRSLESGKLRYFSAPISYYKSGLCCVYLYSFSFLLQDYGSIRLPNNSMYWLRTPSFPSNPRLSSTQNPNPN